MMKSFMFCTRVTLILVLGFAFVRVAEMSKNKGGDKQVGSSIPKPIKKLLKPIRENVLKVLLGTVSFIRQLQAVPNRQLDRHWKELSHDLHEVKAMEMFLDLDVRKTGSKLAEDTQSFEKHVDALVHTAQKLENIYVDHAGKIKKLLGLKDEQSRTQDENNSEWIPGIVLENVLAILGGKPEEPETEESRQLWERLKWTSTKICYLRGLETLLRHALSHEELQADIETIRAMCVVGDL